MASGVKHLQHQVKQLHSKLTEKEEELAEKNREILNQERDRISHEKDMEIKNLKDRITQLEMEVKSLKSQITRLKSDHNDGIQRLEKKLGDMVDIHWLYIGEVARQFSENTFHFVMGDSYKNYDPYFMTDIELYIEDIDDAGAKRIAKDNYQTFIDKTGWKKTMAQYVKEIRKTRNNTAHCCNEDLDHGKAMEAIEELNKKNKLKGIKSKYNVQNIVNMWELSRTGFQ